MPNKSKVKDPRFWKKWYLSGAVQQQKFPPGSLTIVATANHFSGPANGYTTLSLGNKVINSGSGWTVSEPLCAVVVPTSKKYRLESVLPNLPGNAVPVKIFFS